MSNKTSHDALISSDIFNLFFFCFVSLKFVYDQRRRRNRLRVSMVSWLSWLRLSGRPDPGATSVLRIVWTANWICKRSAICFTVQFHAAFIFRSLSWRVSPLTQLSPSLPLSLSLTSSVSLSSFASTLYIPLNLSQTLSISLFPHRLSLSVLALSHIHT